MKKKEPSIEYKLDAALRKIDTLENQLALHRMRLKDSRMDRKMKSESDNQTLRNTLKRITGEIDKFINERAQETSSKNDHIQCLNDLIQDVVNDRIIRLIRPALVRKLKQRPII